MMQSLKNNCAISMCSNHLVTQITDRQLIIIAVYTSIELESHVHFRISIYDEG